MQGEGARWFRELYSQEGVHGVCLQDGRHVVEHDLPFSDARAAEFAQQVDNMVGGYQSVGREVWQIFAAFERSQLLVVCRGTFRLSIIMALAADTATVASRAAHALMHAEPRPEPHGESAPAAGPTRHEVEQVLAGLLGRVVGAPQAAKLIGRYLILPETNGDKIPVEQARKAGLAVLEAVPNRGKRAALASEFLNAIQP